MICPWCGCEYDDYLGYEFEGDAEAVECRYCGKHFDLAIQTTRRYSTKRSLCDMPENYGEEDSE
ncbi:MAG: hypothetical protein IJ960_00800 [Oscillospiraceae bacterium]|nr:hypothetical protein [Oscillospiraceae bacterium]